MIKHSRKPLHVNYHRPKYVFIGWAGTVQEGAPPNKKKYSGISSPASNPNKEGCHNAS